MSATAHRRDWSPTLPQVIQLTSIVLSVLLWASAAVFFACFAGDFWSMSSSVESLPPIPEMLDLFKICDYLSNLSSSLLHLYRYYNLLLVHFCSSDSHSSRNYIYWKYFLKKKIYKIKQLKVLNTFPSNICNIRHYKSKSMTDAVRAEEDLMGEQRRPFN